MRGAVLLALFVAAFAGAVSASAAEPVGVVRLKSLGDALAVEREDAAGVGEGEAAAVAVDRALEAVARDALLLVDDGDAAACDTVEERGLADVRPPDERDRRAPRGCFVSVHAAGVYQPPSAAASRESRRALAAGGGGW